MLTKYLVPGKSQSKVPLRSAMKDLNNLYYFAQVVRHGGFAAAGRELGIPKSKLSKHVAALEDEVGVRLIERSSRKFRVTEIGNSFFEQCEAVLEGVANAESVTAIAKGEPKGLIRVSCPPGPMLDLISKVLIEYMALYPSIRLDIRITGRRVDLIEEEIDVAILGHPRLEGQNSLITRQLAKSRWVLVASPDLIARHGAVTIDTLSTMPTLSAIEDGATDWRLIGPGGEQRVIRHQPSLRCADFRVIRNAAIRGIGVTLLPERVFLESQQCGELQRVVPDWTGGVGTVYAAFTSRKGMLPAVRTFIDFLAVRVPDLSPGLHV